jgi:enoyl-CoA hydratase/carnithine racemase
VCDGIATVTLNRPAQRNALSIDAANRLFRLWDELDADENVRVVILTSTDCGTFCAGMDLKEAAHVRSTEGRDILGMLDDPFYERMRTLRKPIIAAMTGHFAGGGMVLSMNADLRVGLAGTSGGITEARMGRGSPWAMPLVWMLPQPLLMEMTLTGRVVPIERLHEVGFVNYVESTPDAVRNRARALAAEIRDNAPLSVAAGKKCIIRAMALGAEAGVAEAKTVYEPVYASLDAQEGPLAFAEKRAPRWTGC